MHARYFKPLLGRFLSTDPHVNAKRAMWRPQAWNRYAYTDDNPVRNVDRDGRETGDFSTPPSERGGLPFGQAQPMTFKDTITAILALPTAVLGVGLGLEAVSGFLVEAGILGGGPAAEMARRILGDPNKMNHIFSDKHMAGGLAELSEVLGGREEVVGAVSEAIANIGADGLNARSDGAFSAFVMVGGEVVKVTGNVTNGVVVIGNFWVQPPPV